MTEFNALRPITQRLTSTPVQELPHIAYFLASSIASCGQALQTTSSPTASRSNDDAVLVHKLKTRISTLLQERSQEGRFTAVVLIKAVVEAGGREILSSSSESWMRGLLAILGRPDSISTKKLCLITITRIFSLTEQYPTLVREITTPSLPAFITACLTLVKPKVVRTGKRNTTVLSPLIEPVLRSFAELLPYHPTIFRPFTPRLNSIVLSLIGDASAPLRVSDVASNVLSSLHFSAPKNGAGAEWAQTCKSIISSCHMAADQLFRPVMEDWEGSEHIEASGPVSKNYDDEVQARGPDVLGLQSWSGVYEGTQRIVRLLRLLARLLTLSTAQSVSCPIGSLLDMTARLAAVTALSDARAPQFSVRLNTEVSREEREELWMQLPSIHIATLDLLSATLQTVGEAALPISRIVFDQAVNLFEAEHGDEGLRIAAYRLTERVLALVGSSFTRLDANVLTLIIRRCCADLILPADLESSPVSAASTNTNGSKHKGTTSIDVDSFTGHQRGNLQSDRSLSRKPVYQAAFRLLSCFLRTLPASTISRSLRTQIDRTAILVQNRSAMLASVLSPPPTEKGQLAPPSIMPFLARASSGDLEVEGLLRPRMPLVSYDQLQPSAYAETSEEEGGIGTDAAEYTRVDDTWRSQLPDEPNSLDRRGHSLDQTPADKEHDADQPSLSRRAINTNELYPSQSLSESNSKRGLAAINDEGANDDQGLGVQDVSKSHGAADWPSTNTSKRRCLEGDATILDSGNKATTAAGETPGLHESELQLTSNNSLPHVSSQEKPAQGAETLAYTSAPHSSGVHDSDDESDFEIPEIIDSTSEDDEG